MARAKRTVIPGCALGVFGRGRSEGTKLPADWAQCIVRPNDGDPVPITPIPIHVDESNILSLQLTQDGGVNPLLQPRFEKELFGEVVMGRPVGL